MVVRSHPHTCIHVHARSTTDARPRTHATRYTATTYGCCRHTTGQWTMRWRCLLTSLKQRNPVRAERARACEKRVAGWREEKARGRRAGSQAGPRRETGGVGWQKRGVWAGRNGWCRLAEEVQKFRSLVLSTEYIVHFTECTMYSVLSAVYYLEV